MYLKKECQGNLFEELTDFVGGCDKIYLYGAGEVAFKFASILIENSIDWVAFLTTESISEGMAILGHSVYCISDIKFKETDGIILAVAEKTQSELLANLEKIKCHAKVYGQRFFARNYAVPTSGSSNVVDKHQGFFGKFQELNRWGEKFNTDKHHKDHDYLRKYELFLQFFKDKEFTLLELGVLHGGSLFTWGGANSKSGYFSKARIIGVDVDQNCLQRVSEQQVIIKDLSMTENLEELKKIKASVIVDDASHIWSQQIIALIVLWDSLPSGGIYIMEDIETSFPHMGYAGFDDAVVSAYDVCQGIAECVSSGGNLRKRIPLHEHIEEIASNIDMIAFIHGSCIMIKK